MNKSEKELTDCAFSQANKTETVDITELFPVIELSKSELNSAKKIPFASLAALGTAFSQIPQAARTIVTTATREIATNETLFVGINPKGIPGYLLQNEYGTTGNIMQINEQGKRVIAGRMRFKPIDGLPVKETTNTVMPFDPTMMVVAVALVVIEKKLDGIQNSIDNVLEFLESDKRAKQRGNLNKLAEIAEDYRQKGNDKDFCANRNISVQRIQEVEMHNIEFYQEEIAKALKNRKLLHLTKNAKEYIETIHRDFAEYQLACYLYAYCLFLDIMLRKDFEEAYIDNCCKKINHIADCYDELFSECHSQIASYQRSTVENKVLGGIGKTANTLGRTIGSIPIIEKGPVDELLVDAGQVLKDVNKKAVKSKVDIIENFKDNRMDGFIDGIKTIGALYNDRQRIFIDANNIYCLDFNEAI